MKADLGSDCAIEAFYIKPSDVVNNLKEILEQRCSQLSKIPWIEGIQSKRQCVPVTIGKITYRQPSSSQKFKTFQLFSIPN